MLFEICASTPVDVAVAKEAGADRVELCGHWECGGLTPSMASIRASVNLGLPVDLGQVIFVITSQRSN